MRPVVRALFAVSAVILAAAVSVFIVPRAQAATAVSRAFTISVTTMTPRWATAGSTITISGTVSNHTGATLSGLTVQAETGQPVGTRSQLNAFEDGVPGSGVLLSPADGLADQLASPLANGATARWSVSFSAAPFSPLNGGPPFAIYPIQVLASSVTATSQATANTFLPYWGGKGSAVPLQTSWIWPLIGTPQQGACPQTLATSDLASSVAPGGRLSTLVTAAAPWSQSDRLTWAIDPALLSDVKVMTQTYHTGGNSACSDRNQQPKSTAASTWLSDLQTETAGQSAFLTPYADVDVAALSHNGLNADIQSAYSVGRQVAGEVMPATFGKNGTGGGDATVLAAAWPANGAADTQVLDSLVSDGGISTVVLRTGELPSSAAPWDTALQRTATSTGKPVPALLADSEITSLLGSATASSSAGAQFAVTQDFLAQTAMIVAEAQNDGRSVVIAPPSNWDPSAAEATTLLRLTSRAPWLHPAALGTLATAAAKLEPHPLRASQVSHAELPGSYLDKVSDMDSSLKVYTDLLYQPSKQRLSSLEKAAAVTESVAWRGSGSPGGWLALTELSDYLTDQENKVQILSSRPILLAGNSGTTLVSVQNLMDVPVQVRVYASTAPGGPLSVGSFDTSPDSLRIIQPGQTNTIRMPLRSASIGTTTLQLELRTANGSPLAWTARPLSVEVTHLGRTLLVIIGAALGVLVLTSAFRLRRKRKAGGRHADDADEHASDADEMAEAGGTG